MYVAGSLFTAHFSTAHLANAVNNKTNKDKSQSNEGGTITGLFKSYSKQTSSEDRITNLMDRKQKILDMKEEKKQQDIEKGYDQKAIEADLAQYDNMTAEIDQQIAQIRQEDAKKAQNSKKSVDKGEKSTAGASNSNQSDDQASQNTDKVNLQKLTAFQTAHPRIEAITHAANLLKTQALRYQPSLAFKGHPDISAKLTAKADSLQADIASINRKLNHASSPSYRKEQIQNYKHTQMISSNDDHKPTNYLDNQV